MSKPVHVAITGAAGQIGYSLLFRIAAGEMLGLDQPVSLQLLEITPALDALNGVVMELKDSAFPLLHNVTTSDKAEEAFKDADIAILVGARPRGPGMERKDLLEANAKIFSGQGKALNDHASKDVRVLVVGNPANTNALIASANAPDLDPRHFSAMTRLDHNRALSQLSAQTRARVSYIRRMTIWGNHSATQVPDVAHCTIGGTQASTMVQQSWIEDSFIPTVQQRGGAIIKARGASSAASAAGAAMDHIRDWMHGTPEGDWVSMAIPSDGSYDIPKGVMYSFPVTCHRGEANIVQGLAISDFTRERMIASHQELLEEKDGVKDLLVVG